MVAVRRRLGRENQNQAFLELKPDWMVLRPVEVSGNLLIDSTRLAEFYEPVLMMDVSAQVDAIRWLPGRRDLTGDEVFLIYHRKSPPKPAN
jgi:hypothetical protein